MDHKALPIDLSYTQRTRDAIIASLLRQNDVATSFWRNNDVIIARCVRWDNHESTEMIIQPQQKKEHNKTVYIF